MARPKPFRLFVVEFDARTLSPVVKEGRQPRSGTLNLGASGHDGVVASIEVEGEPGLRGKCVCVARHLIWEAGGTQREIPGAKLRFLSDAASPNPHEVAVLFMPVVPRGVALRFGPDTLDVLARGVVPVSPKDDVEGGHGKSEQAFAILDAVTPMLVYVEPGEECDEPFNHACFKITVKAAAKASVMPTLEIASFSAPVDTAGEEVWVWIE